MKISSRKVNTEIQQHIEVTPAFSAGNSRRYAEIFGTKRVRSGWRGKSDNGGHNIVPIFFVSAKKTILDQKKGPVAPTHGRIFPGSFFIRWKPDNHLDRLCRDQF